MSQIKLSSTDLKLLGHLELEAERSFVTVGKELRRHSTSLQRRFQRLIELGVVAGKTAIFDISRLGLIEYGFYFELGARSQRSRDQFVRSLTNTPGISWVADIGGAYDIAVNILARHPREVADFLDTCTVRFPRLIVKRHMVQRTTRIRFFRGYLAGKHGERFRSGDGPADSKLTPEEHQVIRALDGLKFESLRELARQERMSEATFSRIVRKLRDQRVLLGFGYRLRTESFGRLQFRALLSFHSLTPKLILDLETYLPKHDAIKLLVRCLGPWDYEIEFDVNSLSEARDLSAWIWERYGNDLIHCEQIPIFEHLKYISFGTTLVKR